MRNKYITLSAIPSHEMNNCDQDTPRCYCEDEAKIVYTMKRKSGHLVYPQRVLTPPDWGQCLGGTLRKRWWNSEGALLWLEHRMREFSVELDGHYEILNARRVVSEDCDAERRDFRW